MANRFLCNSTLPAPCGAIHIITDDWNIVNLCRLIAGGIFHSLEVVSIYIYPNNLKAKPTLWLWALRDVAVIGVSFILSVLALAQLGLAPPLIATVLYAFLSIRLEDASILDFLRYALCFLFLKQQYFEWRENET